MLTELQSENMKGGDCFWRPRHIWHKAFKFM